MTIKQCIADALEDLTQTDFRKFCDQLRDRTESPRIRRRAVEDKSIWEIAELLVSTFTEPKALQVAIDTLRQINCNQEAETLEQETKALLDKGGRKRKTKPSPAKTKPSTTKTKPSTTKTKPSTTKVNPSSSKKSLNMITFGKHKGKTFKWLLKNDMDYIAYIVASHQKELEGATGSKMDQHMANKDALTEFASAYPEVMEEVRFNRAYMESREAALKSRQKGKVLVGFGPDRWGTLKDLYESNDLQKISLVKSLRTKKSTCIPDSKMEFAINYILKRDKARAAATKRRINSTAQALTKKRTREPCVQSNSSQPTNDSGPIRKKQKRS